MVTSPRVLAPASAEHDAVLTADALSFVAELARRFSPRLQELLAARRERQGRFDAGELPRFLPETRTIRESDWRVAPLPEDLIDRRVEITGPVDRKMVINALNSGANVYMADFEDSTCPTWDNLVSGQKNLIDAVRRTITFDDPERGKSYRLNDRTAVLMVRPRGWHLPEKHLEVDGAAVPGALFDFGLFFFHNARELVRRGTGPYFYLPKLQAHQEARLWNDVFVFAQEKLGLRRGTVRATVLIETLPAAFEMHEILYELRDHSAGLNCGRWDYIFSYIKTLRAHPRFRLPDRAQVTMEQPNMRAYTQLVVRTCHARGASAMGGMAAQIPIKGDDHANDRALAKVRADKLREVRDGHDGTWVAHPGLVAVARQVFDAHMKGSNQLDVRREDVEVTAEQLLVVPTGTRTEAGVRHNVSVGIRYLEAWLRGIGCVPLDNLMEDAATAEISRAQIWQWLKHRAKLDDGRTFTPDLFRGIVEQETKNMAGGAFEAARALFVELSTASELADFLTLPAYERITTRRRHAD